MGTIKQVEEALEANLKQYIRQTHYESGNLYDSISVSIDGQNNLVITAAEYILFLDDGDFIEDFFNLPSTISILEDYVALTIETDET